MCILFAASILFVRNDEDVSALATQDEMIHSIRSLRIARFHRDSSLRDRGLLKDFPLDSLARASHPVLSPAT